MPKTVKCNYCDNKVQIHRYNLSEKSAISAGELTFMLNKMGWYHSPYSGRVSCPACAESNRGYPRTLTSKTASE